MSELPGMDTIIAQMRLELDELKKNYREAVWKASAILGHPREDDDWPEVFVMMPFAPKLKPVYEDHIKRPLESELQLRVGRANDFFGSEPVMKDVWSAIHAARVLIADCTGHNANVFYELGLAHAIGKSTILISQSAKDIPFDIRYLRIIPYEFTPRGMKAFEEILVETIRRGMQKESLRADSR